MLFFANRGPVPGFGQADIDTRIEGNRVAGNATMETAPSLRLDCSDRCTGRGTHVPQHLAEDMMRNVTVEDQYKSLTRHGLNYSTLPAPISSASPVSLSQ